MVKNALVDRSVENAPELSRFQFERVGFFAVDRDSTKEKVLTDDISSPKKVHTSEFIGERQAINSFSKEYYT